MPKELFSDSECDVGYQVYPGGGRHKGREVAVFVRWNKREDGFASSRFIPVEELPDLLILVQRAVEKYSQTPKTKAKRK
ncbi:MAG: hypothetical protein JNL58_30445 [Planctomyces sp.]|jgi:hypothetical protein|nr:hypothetical protein [Planctomyces sp.]